MGALKIAKRLEKEGILISKELGKARFYKLNLENSYVIQYVKFLLKREAEQDIKENIKKVDKPLLNAIKRIVMFGEGKG